MPPAITQKQQFLSANRGQFLNCVLLERVQSAYQTLEFYEDSDLGVSFWMDGQIMSCSNYYEDYHEALSIPALLSLTPLAKQLSASTISPLRVLICGGADLMTAKSFIECTDQKQLKIDLVDIDSLAIEKCSQHFYPIISNVLLSPALNIYCQDANEYIKSYTSEYDCITLDLTDIDHSGAISNTIYLNPLFYKNAASRLSSKGVMTGQLGVLDNTDFLQEFANTITPHFSQCLLYKKYCHVYMCEVLFFIAFKDHATQDTFIQNMTSFSYKEKLSLLPTQCSEQTLFAMFCFSKKEKENIPVNLLYLET